MTDQLERVHQLLQTQGSTVSTAESLTGGRLSVAFTDVPGASASYLGGVVSYATDVKASLLGVPAHLIERHGVVSPECARAMAEGVRMLTGATYGLATTGVAGPSEQEGKPPGTVYVGIAGPDLSEAVALELRGKRQQIQDRACQEAVVAFLDVLRREETSLG